MTMTRQKSKGGRKRSTWCDIVKVYEVDRTKLAQYVLNPRLSRSRRLVTKLAATSGGQFLEGRNTLVKKSSTSWPRALRVAAMHTPISPRVYRKS